tara:strand:+ start:1935 stop:2255 length:321 start_codon:yes stop_codon:yes gene_type:complete
MTIFLLIAPPLNPSFLFIEFLTELFLLVADLLDNVASYSYFFLATISLIALKSASACNFGSVYYIPEPNPFYAEFFLCINGGKFAFLFRGGLCSINPPLAALYILF